MSAENIKVTVAEDAVSIPVLYRKGDIEIRSYRTLSPAQCNLLEVGGNLVETLIRKNTDYGSSVWESPILAPTIPAKTAILVRMSDKVKRIAQLFSNDPLVASESMLDSIRDLAGYSLLYDACPEPNTSPEPMTHAPDYDEAEVVKMEVADQSRHQICEQCGQLIGYTYAVRNPETGKWIHLNSCPLVPTSSPKKPKVSEEDYANERRFRTLRHVKHPTRLEQAELAKLTKLTGRE